MKRNQPQRFALDAIVLDDKDDQPLYRQLEGRLREIILHGGLKAGTRLPSTRQLALDLGVSRNTVVSAYDQLTVEGYLHTAHGSGTRVTANLPEHLLQVPARKRADSVADGGKFLTPSGRRIAAFAPWIEMAADRSLRPFRAHTPASDLFPFELWSRLTARRMRFSSDMLLSRVDQRGHQPLREAVAEYLRTTRGVPCNRDEVVITSGVQQAIDLCATLFIDPGDVVVMEEPGYTPARTRFEAAGADVRVVPVDSEGLDVDSVQNTPDAKLIYVTPGAQFPLGSTLSLSRRIALMAWAEQAGVLVLEDDYNGEYRYKGRPLPALYGMGKRGRVFYMGSFSKLLFPSLRLGYVVVPDEFVDAFGAARWLADRHSPPLEQAVLTDFINEGHFVRHVRRMRMVYAERQAALAAAAEAELAGWLDVPRCDAGLHLVGWLDNSLSESSLLQACRSANVDVSPTSWFSRHRTERTSVLLGFAPFTPKKLQLAVKRLAQALDG